MKKSSMYLIIFLIIVSRFLDGYLTYLIDPGLVHEMNPLQKRFGLGWTGIIIANIVVVIILILSLRRFWGNYNKYFPKKKMDFSDFSKYYVSGGHYSWTRILFDMRLFLNKKFRAHFLNYGTIIIPIALCFLLFVPVVTNSLILFYDFQFDFSGYNYVIFLSIIALISFVLGTYGICKYFYKLSRKVWVKSKGTIHEEHADE